MDANLGAPGKPDTSAVGAKEDSPAFQHWVGLIKDPESLQGRHRSRPTLSPTPIAVTNLRLARCSAAPRSMCRDLGREGPQLYGRSSPILWVQSLPGCPVQIGSREPSLTDHPAAAPAKSQGSPSAAGRHRKKRRQSCAVQRVLRNLGMFEALPLPLQQCLELPP